MDEYKKTWEQMVKFDLNRPETFKEGTCILIGIIKAIKTHIGKSGKMAFVTLEDYNGEIDITFFSQAWERCESKIEIDKIAIIRGRIEYQKDKDRHGMLADDILNISEAQEQLDKEESLDLVMKEFRDIWENEVKLDLSNPAGSDSKEDYTIIGILKDLKPFHTKNGNDMAYASLTDYNGEISITIFPKPWSEMKEKLEENTVAALRGKIKKDSFKNKYVLYADASLSIDRLKSKKKNDNEKSNGAGRELHIRLQKAATENEEALFTVRNILSSNPGPSQVFFHIPLQRGETIIRTADQINAGKAAPDLNQCAGIAEIWESGVT